MISSASGFSARYERIGRVAMLTTEPPLETVEGFYGTLCGEPASKT
jgi:hypothetical protein